MSDYDPRHEQHTQSPELQVASDRCAAPSHRLCAEQRFCYMHFRPYFDTAPHEGIHNQVSLKLVSFQFSSLKLMQLVPNIVKKESNVSIR